MKPGKRDRKVKVLITGAELQELHRHVWLLTETFGLDRRIDHYQGKRPIGLYSWDLEALVDVVSFALEDKKAYPTQSGVKYQALQNLHKRLKAESIALDELMRVPSEGPGRIKR
ncbi:MAG TPA: hypothetical protein PLC98_24940 [Anaerolineales bacterium]|nr:hypothetical protein [Anaerolineales bacterium]